MTIRAKVIENSPAVLLARITRISGNVMTMADVSAISVKVWNTDDNSLVTTITPSVASSVYDTLQKDGRWNQDATGYNLAIVVTGAAWPTEGRYQVEVKITPASGEAFYVVYKIEAENILSE